jgi:hypothetical protein
MRNYSKQLKTSMVGLGLIIIISMLTGFTVIKKEMTVKPCRYYAYILFGDAAIVSDIKRTEKVYKATNIFKSEEGYRACCNDYCSDRCAGFSIKNIGPYESEAVCYSELQNQIKRIETLGYTEYVKNYHMIIGVLDFNYKQCN